jgi:hypothetical protein
MRIQEAQIHSDPTAQDPEHWLELDLEGQKLPTKKISLISLSARCSFLRAKWFSCCLGVLYLSIFF